jgi:hypothetical protein
VKWASRGTAIFPKVLIAVFLTGACVIRAAEQASPQPPPASRPVRSASGRFTVYSPDFAEKARLCAWADDAAARTEKLIGIPLSFQRRIFRISAFPLGEGERPSVSRRTRSSGGWLTQELVIRGLDRTPGETVLEAFCELLIDGYVPAMTPGDAAGDGPRLPQWLSVGVAQNLYPFLRARNSKAALRRLKEQRLPEFTDLLEWEYVPQGRWMEKAYCGLAVAWLASGPDAASDFRAIFRRAAEREPISAEWLAAHVQGGRSVSAMNSGWREWVARQDRKVYDLGGLSYEMVEDLSAALVIQPEELPGAAAEGEVPLAELIRMRRSPAVRMLGARLTAELQRISIGKAPEFSRVTDAYCRFLQGLNSRCPGFVLRHRLRTADRLLNTLDATVRAWKEYVDNAELAVYLSEEQKRPPPGRAIGNSELRAYVDEWERQMDARPADHAGPSRGRADREQSP